MVLCTSLTCSGGCGGNAADYVWLFLVSLFMFVWERHAWWLLCRTSQARSAVTKQDPGLLFDRSTSQDFDLWLTDDFIGHNDANSAKSCFPQSRILIYHLGLDAIFKLALCIDASSLLDWTLTDSNHTSPYSNIASAPKFLTERLHSHKYLVSLSIVKSMTALIFGRDMPMSCGS